MLNIRYALLNKIICIIRYYIFYIIYVPTEFVIFLMIQL